MKFHVLTLFPEMIENYFQESIMGRASKNQLIEVEAINIRDYSTEKHGKVDDYTYGGGAGMLMQAQPVYDAWMAASKGKKIRTVYVTPQGKCFHQELAKELAREEELIFLCGHYEGIDERVLEEVVTDYISIGDYVLTGGELPAMVMMDSISRFIRGVLNNDESAETESFYNDLLEYPQYSRPAQWHGKKVPAVLLSGNHKEIMKWRRQEAEERTKRIRPDLYQRYERRQQVIESLRKDKLNNACLIDALSRDLAELLYVEKDLVIGKHKALNQVWICGNDLAAAVEAIKQLPQLEAMTVVHNIEGLNEYLESLFGFHVRDACYQSVYTLKEAMPVTFKDITEVRAEDIPYIAEHYDHGDEAYIRDRYEASDLFGAYVDERLVGFAGMHDDGSLGILYVDPEYRKGHIGSSLAAFIVNKALERGGLPYAHIVTTNTISIAMQKRMGMYIAKKKIYWTGK